MASGLVKLEIEYNQIEEQMIAVCAASESLWHNESADVNFRYSRIYAPEPHDLIKRLQRVKSSIARLDLREAYKLVSRRGKFESREKSETRR